MPRTQKEPLPDSPATKRSGTVLQWIVQLVLPLGLGAGLLVGVMLLGRHLSARLREAGEHTVVFSDIDCDPPPGMTRAEFLGEAQYLAGLPDQLNVLDPATRQRMFDALALHPWVVRVHQLDLSPSSRVRVEIEYRRPALIVGANRVVDEEGVLLPRQASTRGLPRLTNKVRPPSDRAGQRWEDPILQAAARVAGLERDELVRRGGSWVVEVVDGEVILQLGRTRILWGRPPGQESPGEVTAAIKARRLAEAGDLDGQQWDLRPEAGLQRTARK